MSVGSEGGNKRVDLQVLEGVPAFVELGGLRFSGSSDRRNGIRGFGDIGVRFEGFRGASQGLDHLLEGGCIGLDEGCWVWV